MSKVIEELSIRMTFYYREKHWTVYFDKNSDGHQVSVYYDRTNQVHYTTIDKTTKACETIARRLADKVLDVGRLAKREPVRHRQ